MKKLSRLHLVEMEKNKLTPKQMKKVVGGCSCGCCYSGSGGSSSGDNGGANIDGGLYSYNC